MNYYKEEEIKEEEAREFEAMQGDVDNVIENEIDTMRLAEEEVYEKDNTIMGQLDALVGEARKLKKMIENK